MTGQEHKRESGEKRGYWGVNTTGIHYIYMKIA
jgi:hypothetical protein